VAGDAFYITTPIYYLNGTPHIGHAYTTTVADVLARWARLQGRKVRFLTGTDEHGQKVLQAAEERGVDPKTHCDELVVVWKTMMERLRISYDRFIRTTDDDHVEVVQAVLQALHDKGDLYRGEYRGWYFVRDEVFVTEKDRADRIASGDADESHFRLIEEANWFFRMSAYQERLIERLRSDAGLVLPENRRNEVLGFLRQPLDDLCISRPKSRMSWGIEIPFDRDFVCYVWFDALLNYLTGTGYHPKSPGAEWRTWWPANAQLIGKDILTTHSVYWTTMLLALEVALPEHLFAHGWWVSAEGAKMSKSKGNVIDVDRLIDGFGLDAVRSFFLREIRFGADGQFSYRSFLTRYNADLANDLGNLLHRALSMTTRWCGGVPERDAPDPALLSLAQQTVSTFRRSMGALQLKEAADAVFELVGAGNKFVDTRAPWALHKAGKTGEVASTMRDVLEICALAATLLLPILPGKAPEMLARLGASEDDAKRWVPALLRGDRLLALLAPGATLTVGDPLFPRIAEMPAPIAALFEDDLPAAPRGTASETPVPNELPPAPAQSDAPLPDMIWIEIQDFQKVALRIGRVLACVPHPNADKLLVLTVELGEARPRTICAGIRHAFAPESLVGRNVVVVANLKPRVLRGVPSEGMILAAGRDGALDLLTVNAEPGSSVS
jgi:methionyl-tRNA synthetase